MNIVILVVAFWGARVMRDTIEELIVEHLPASDNKGVRLLQKLFGAAVGWGIFLLYIYFAGYRIMDKDANLTLAWIIALCPNVIFYGYKLLFTKAALIE
jgi:hypothetical protein